MFWRTDVPSSARLNSSEPHVRWPSVTILGLASSATPLSEPAMLQVPVVLTVCLKLTLLMFGAQKAYEMIVLMKCLCCADEMFLLCRWSFSVSQLFVWQQSTQHFGLLSVSTQVFILYWPDRTCPVVLCGTQTSACWSEFFFVFMMYFHQCNIHIKYSVLCVQHKGTLFKPHQSSCTIHSVHCE